MVPVVGLEPTRGISPTDFESVTSTNSITPADTFIIHDLLRYCKCFFNCSRVWGRISARYSRRSPWTTAASFKIATGCKNPSGAGTPARRYITAENMNRIVRRFFPKGTNFDEATAAEVVQAETWMNNYPRAILGWRSAGDLFAENLPQQRETEQNVCSSQSLQRPRLSFCA